MWQLTERVACRVTANRGNKRDIVEIVVAGRGFGAALLQSPRGRQDRFIWARGPSPRVFRMRTIRGRRAVFGRFGSWSTAERRPVDLLRRAAGSAPARPRGRIGLADEVVLRNEVEDRGSNTVRADARMACRASRPLNVADRIAAAAGAGRINSPRPSSFGGPPAPGPQLRQGRLTPRRRPARSPMPAVSGIRGSPRPAVSGTSGRRSPPGPSRGGWGWSSSRPPPARRPCTSRGT